MPAIINTLIGLQSYELVRDRIGLILTTELNNQAVNLGNYYADADVWVERFVKPTVNEEAIVNVTIAGATYDGQTVLQADGTVKYNIDIYCKAETEGTDKEEQGDYLAMYKLQRLVGICRSILQDARYITLGFARPFIMGRNVLKFDIANPNSEDMQSHVMARIVVQVKMPETTSYTQPQTAEGVDTVWTLQETPLGYKYVINV